MENLGYYNGKFGPLDEMTVPFNDRVHFFGDGVYEATPARNHKIFALDEHVDRFFRSAALLDIKIPHTKDELKAILSDMVKKVDSGEQFVYWQVTRGTAMRNHIYADDMQGNLWISLKPAPLKDVYKPIAAITAEDTRFFHCNIKTLNLLPAVMYAQAAERAGVYETILYRRTDTTPATSTAVPPLYAQPGTAHVTPPADARVTECAHSNIHIINEKGEFQTAPTDNLILPGIARIHLIRACAALGIPVREEPFTVAEMMAAREVIISSSSAPTMHCVSIDDQPVGGRAADTVRALQDYVMEEIFTATRA